MELAETGSHLLLELAAGVVRIHLLGALPHGDLVFRGTGDFLLQTLYTRGD
jgi:hypothetical protein